MRITYRSCRLNVSLRNLKAIGGDFKRIWVSEFLSAISITSTSKIYNFPFSKFSDIY